MREKYKLFLIVSLLALLVFFPFTILVQDSADARVSRERPEDWTDGPGWLHTRSGVNKTEFVELWNLDREEGKTKYNTAQNFTEDMEDDNRISWKRKVNWADTIDFSGHKYTYNATNWNSQAANGFASKATGRTTSYVPQGLSGGTKSGKFIKKAYIEIYAITPKYVERNLRKNSPEHVFIKPQGKVYTVVEYRDVHPPDNNPHLKIEWKNLNSTIRRHRLNKTEDCSGKDCIMQNKTGDNMFPTQSLSYPGKQDKLGKRETDAANVETDIQVDGKIVTNWKKNVSMCNETNDNDHDGLSDPQEKNVLGTDPFDKNTDGDGLKDGYEINHSNVDVLKADTDGDGLEDGYELDNNLMPDNPDTDEDGVNDKKDKYPQNPNKTGITPTTSTYTPTNPPTSTPTEGTQTQSNTNTNTGNGDNNQTETDSQNGFGATGLQFSHSNNLDNDGECSEENWHLINTSYHHEEMTVRNSIHVETARNRPAPILERAVMPDGSVQIAIRTPINQRLWTYAETPNGNIITSGVEYYSAKDLDWARLQIYYDRNANPQIQTNINTPTKTRMFMSNDQRFIPNPNRSLKPRPDRRLLFVGGGPKRQVDPKPGKLLVPWPENNTYRYPELIVFETVKGDGVPLKFHGIGGTNIKGATTSRKVKKSNITAELLKYNNSKNTAKIKFTLRGIDGEPINTNRRGSNNNSGVIIFKNEVYETNSTGEVVFKEKLPWNPMGYTVTYKPVDWFGLPMSKQAYTGDSTTIRVSGGVDFWDFFNYFLPFLIILLIFYYALRRPLKRTLGIDLKKHIVNFFETIFGYFKF